jgi:hypothetical protein
MSPTYRSATRRKTSDWNQFRDLGGTFLRWRRRGFWDHDLLDVTGGGALCSIQKLPFRPRTMALHGTPCQFRRDGSTPSAWVLSNASGHKILSVTGNPVWQTDDPVLELRKGDQIVFTVDTLSPSRAVMSCTNMRSNTLIARLRWRSRSWWRPLSTVEVVVEPKVALTESIVGLVMLASIDFLPQILARPGGSGGMGG